MVKPVAQSYIRKEPVMRKSTTVVALDAHKKFLQVAMLIGRAKEFIEWTVANEPAAIRRMVRKILRLAKGRVRICYEAGPCGYALKREIEKLGVECVVIAPSLIPRKPGDRIKTDRRDARKLAELFRAGLLTEVAPPTEGEESLRDLCRCREDANGDYHRAQHRLNKMLLRRGIIWQGGKSSWTKKHWEWLRSLTFDHPADKIVFEDYLSNVELMKERLNRLEQALEAAAEEEPYRERVAALKCFRGIRTVTAVTLVSELHDFRRFTSPRDLMGYLGLVPSEHSSSDRKSRGNITKTGNSHARRVLIEAAWQYRHPPRIGDQLRKRREGQSATVVAIADKAGQRLYRRYSSMYRRGKPVGKVIVAVARELVGFIWAALFPLTAKAAA